MRKEDKAIIIEKIGETLKEYSCFYLTDTTSMDAEQTSAFRRACFNAEVKMMVVKNTLLHKALEQLEGDYSELYPAKPSFPTDCHTHTCLVAAEDNQYKKIMPAYANRSPVCNCI